MNVKIQISKALENLACFCLVIHARLRHLRSSGSSHQVLANTAKLKFSKSQHACKYRCGPVHKYLLTHHSIWPLQEYLDKSVLDVENVHAYVELHIEQGPLLENDNKEVGVVTGILGPSVVHVQFNGSGGHGGGMPMEFRLSLFSSPFNQSCLLFDFLASGHEKHKTAILTKSSAVCWWEFLKLCSTLTPWLHCKHSAMNASIKTNQSIFELLAGRWPIVSWRKRRQNIHHFTLQERPQPGCSRSCIDSR